MPIGQKFGGFDVVIKTCKKKWELKGKWVQQIVILAVTCVVLADVNIQISVTLHSGTVLHMTVGIVQEVVETGKKIYIDQFTLPSDIGEPEQQFTTPLYGTTDNIIRGKIRCWLVASYIQAKRHIDKAEIEELVDYVIDGK